MNDKYRRSAARDPASGALVPMTAGRPRIIAGTFIIEREIARGSTGELLLARSLADPRRRVAIKVLHSFLWTEPFAVERMRREGELAMRIDHEHVARVYEAGRLDDGAPYLIMEHLEGHDLASVLADGPLPVFVALDFMRQACLGLRAAHALDIVHRDIKPSNLFLAIVPGGTKVKVLDFGVAKPEPDCLDLRLTTTGQVLGSPGYMAPEQLASPRDVDLRADVWSVGATLYKLLTGSSPYEAFTFAQLCLRAMHGPLVPITERRRNLPPEVTSLVERCLSRDRSLRYPSMDELIEALVGACSVSWSVTPQRPFRRPGS
jgi:eukaryotic-like serine/threonine-protein kinase